MEAPAPPLSIIVVDDNPVDVQLIRWVLDAQALPYELQVIDNGDYALDVVDHLAQQEPLRSPTIMLLDLNLPKNDGIEILEAMRANPALAGVPVAILSSSSSPHDQARVERFHISRFIAKPPDLDQYLEIGVIIRQLLLETGSRDL